MALEDRRRRRVNAILHFEPPPAQAVAKLLEPDDRYLSGRCGRIIAKDLAEAPLECRDLGALLNNRRLRAAPRLLFLRRDSHSLGIG